MRREYIFIWHLTCLFFFLHFEGLYTKAEESGNEYSKGCAHLHCESGSRCIKRRFWCKNPPCPGMLYCSRSRKESLKGPLTCDTVRCSRGHTCIVRVRGCHWDGNCQQQVARCIPEKEYYEGAASCAGFDCPSGKRCILRETYCVNPPCKLIRSCADAEDVETWFDECKSLNCTSEYECFLRRPENNCLDPWCTHTPDCTLTVEDELVSKYCYGWICPRMQKCSVQIVGSCKGFNCTVERSCRASSISSVKHDANTNDEVADSARKTLMEIENKLNRQELDRRTTTQANYPVTRGEDEDDGGWIYQAPQEPYRILLPPYEPVIVIDRRQGLFFSFFTDAFDYPFNEAALPEITSRDTIGDSKTNNISMIVNDKIGNYVNASTTVKIENFRTNHFDDTSGNYANVPAMEKTNTVPPNIRDKQPNNYYDDWQLSYMIHDYLERNEPQQ